MESSGPHIFQKSRWHLKIQPKRMSITGLYLVHNIAMHETVTIHGRIRIRKLAHNTFLVGFPVAVYIPASPVRLLKDKHRGCYS
jgi:hypothetical protein